MDFILAGIDATVAAASGPQGEAVRFRFDRFAVDDLVMPVMIGMTPLGPMMLDEATLSRPVGAFGSGSPLDYLASGFEFGGLDMAVGDFTIAMDPLRASYARNSQGQATRMTMTGGTYRMSLPLGSATGGEADDGLALLRELGLQRLEARWNELQGDWDPATDRMAVQPFTVSVTGMGQASFGYVMGGAGQWVNRMTLRQFSELMAEAAAAGTMAADEPDAGNRALMRMLGRTYAGMTLISAQASVEDQGIVQALVRIMAREKAVSEAAARDELLAPVETTIALKSAPLFERIFSQQIQRLVLQGGRIDMRIAPPAPLDLGQLLSQSPSVAALGLTTTHTPPTAARR
jgi:hypothetical protein